jgi:hypothetical protein
MSTSQQRGRLLVTALAAVLAGSFSGAPDLVLCLGANGHRALEIEHPGMLCASLAGAGDTSGLSAPPLAECLDLPTSGAGPTGPSFSDPERMPTPPPALRVASPQPPPLAEALRPEPIAARAGPDPGSRQLRSTVLLA